MAHKKKGQFWPLFLALFKFAYTQWSPKLLQEGPLRMHCAESAVKKSWSKPAGMWGAFFPGKMALSLLTWVLFFAPSSMVHQFCWMFLWDVLWLQNMCMKFLLFLDHFQCNKIGKCWNRPKCKKFSCGTASQPACWRRNSSQDPSIPKDPRLSLKRQGLGSDNWIKQLHFPLPPRSSRCQTWFSPSLFYPHKEPVR